jgi:hypothetical protein
MATSIGLEGNNSDRTFALKRLFVWNAYSGVQAFVISKQS